MNSALTQKANLLLVDSVIVQGNNAADTIKTQDISKTGYTPVGIVGYAASGNQAAGEVLYNANISGNSISVGWRTAVSTSHGVKFYILYIKNS